MPEHWHAAYVMTNGIRTHFYRTGGENGNGRPVMILAHGSSDNALCWAGAVRELEATYDVILYDQRGHGRSDAPATGYTSEDRAEDLRGLIEALRIEKPILMGHSMGGSTVLSLALAYPHIPRAVVVEDAGLSSRRPGTDQAAETTNRSEELTRRRSQIEARNRMSIDELVTLCRTEVHENWTDPEDCVQWAWAKHEHHPFTASPDARFTTAPSLIRNAADLHAPVLFLKAETEMGTRDRFSEEVLQWHREQVDSYPDAQVVYVEGAGHNVRRDQKARFFDALWPFLNALD